MITLGDENSLQGRTQAHKHSAPSSDGGFLEDTITGVTGSAQGSLVTFSAGSIATDLPIGNNGDSLNVAGGLPVWTAAAGAPPYELVATGVLGAPATSLSVSFAAINGSDISMLKVVACGEWVPSQNVFLQINGINTGANYNYWGVRYPSGTSLTNSDKGQGFINNNLSTSGTSPFFGTAEIQANPITEDVHFNVQGNADNGMNIMGGIYDGSNITSFTEVMLDTSTVNMSTGTWLAVYKILNV